MPTESAGRAVAGNLGRFGGIATRGQLRSAGVSGNAVRTQLEALRWRRLGNAIILHHGPATGAQLRIATLIGHGPRSALTSFTALRGYGLRGWDRPEIHLVAPRGTKPFQHPELPRIRLHQSRRIALAGRHRAETCAASAIRAAGSLSSARHACGLVAAVVQQRVCGIHELHAAATAATRIRHRSSILSALADIEQGAQALSEIDFVRLCVRNGLPAPRLQQVRRDSTGTRRYLDAVWDLPDGRTLVVEVDGALHLAQQRWWSDQLRQNDIALSGALILRFPSAIVRHEPAIVVAQLRQALRCT